jgi:hypothetical protein
VVSSHFPFDRFLPYDELVTALHAFAESNPALVTLEQYGESHQGRALWLATVTDSSTGAHDTKPAHWVDANIHSVEVTGGVAALYLLHHLVSAFSEQNDPAAVEALRTRTFYVVPRVNPDGVEAALGGTFRRSSMRPWPWRDGHRWPGLVEGDIDGDGRVLAMRIVDPHGGWTPHPEDARVMMPVPADGVVAPGTVRYRMLAEGTLTDHDGFTIPTPRPAEGLDLNRNFPAGWGTGVTGSGDHPLSEPEIDALVRAIVVRPNICGYNAFHTSGGVLLRPSSTAPDSSIPPLDLWTWKELSSAGTSITGYPAHSVYEDFTWDKADTMSGAPTTGCTSTSASTRGRPSSGTSCTQRRASREHAHLVRRPDHRGGARDRAVERPARRVLLPVAPVRPPQLGPSRSAARTGSDSRRTRPGRCSRPRSRRTRSSRCTRRSRRPRSRSSTRASTRSATVTWRIAAGVANTGWLPTEVTVRAAKNNLVRPLVVSLDLPDGASLLPGIVNHQRLGQLQGRRSFRLMGGARNDGTPDRVLAQWTVRAPVGTEITIVAQHDRAGRSAATVTLE